MLVSVLGQVYMRAVLFEKRPAGHNLQPESLLRPSPSCSAPSLGPYFPSGLVGVRARAWVVWRLWCVVIGLDGVVVAISIISVNGVCVAGVL